MKIQGRIASSLALLALVAGSSAFASNEPEAVPGEYIVKLKNQYSVQGLNTISLSQRLGAYVKSTIADQNIVVVKRAVVETQDSAVKSLMQNSLVDIAEPNFIYRINKTPNDPELGKLWGLKNFGQADSSNSKGVVGIDVDAERAWDIETGSESVIVAVIDTGVNYNHPDLKENIWTNEAEANGKPGVDDDGNGFVDDVHGMNFVDANKPTPEPLDDHGHGSHCSGTIAARGDDGRGIVGVAWKAKIMGVKFLSAEGSGSLEGAIRAIDYATKMGAKIMSNSWGGGGFSQTLKDAIQRSHEAGALFVAAAGNESNNNDTNPTYPCSYDVPNVLSVAAINNKGGIASFSNYGKKMVHLAAPGVNIYSSVTGNGYDSWSGTSMATPHVSGVAALLAAHEPNLTGVEMKQRLMSTVKPVSAIKNKVKTGGMVNAFFALTNQQAPPDMDDPAMWASKSVSVSSTHPYAKKSNETFELSVDGAKEIAVYFQKFDTERNYDKVTFYDKAGKVVGVMTGAADDSFSPVISGDYVKMVFTSDDSVERYGFDVTKISYR
ncbi:MAG: hypothetical protein BroJett040_09610 [Oligoflexia bacterium]|nr:MAG: hypothetical protein BroJett040_09610 [Oligoflexia bacterium]